MGLNQTPMAERLHIGIFGRRNVGKSSVINAVTNQSVAIVSDVKGTTTDPVFKSMEILPLGPVTLIDTPGIDDEGELGMLRVKKAFRVLNKTDVALLICDCTQEMTEAEKLLVSKFEEKNIPYIIVMNKCDLQTEKCVDTEKIAYVSAKNNVGINELKEKISKIVPVEDERLKIVGDLVQPTDAAVLVVPIDKAAPKGRLILPQQQTIRDLLEANAIAVVAKETELKKTFEALNKKPKIVICDSQVFSKVDEETPKDVLLTSFSILFARYKGNLETLVNGATAVDSLQDGDTILISEGCSHHRQCDDIGTVKIPRWLKEYTHKDITFETSSGAEFPEDLSKYKLIIHCGGCMLNEREMKYRIKCANDANVPIVNYGVFIAYVKGILKRSLQAFPDVASKLTK
jgi:[FeFe] hydrogenase H-cluster maturation GTPase HydF